MSDIEEAPRAINKVASTVVEKGLKAKFKWTADVDIKLASCIFSFPKLDDETQQTEQQNSVTQKCAEVIAIHFLELMKLGKHGMTRKN